MEQPKQQMMVPIWAMVIIAIVIVAIITFIFFFLRRRRTRSLSVDTIHKKEEESIINKKSVSLRSFQTLVTQQKKRSMQLDGSSNNNSFIITTPLPPLPLPNNIKQVEETSPSHINNNNNNNEKTDKPASLIDESEYSYSPPEPPQEMKISLPLPPPSTSFFSDKMELDDGDNSQDLYDMYLSTKKKENNNGFISFDLDSTSFYSNAASSIQQKAATIKSSLYQSLRLQQKSNKASAQQLFSTTKNYDGEQQPKKSGDNSYGYQPTTTENKQQSFNINKNSSTMTTDSNKTIIDMNALTEFNNTTKQPLSHLTVTHNNDDTIAIDDESPINPNPNLQEPVCAAKRVIRSASRKTKTRSMVVNDKDFFPIGNSEEADDDQLLFGGKDGKKSRHGSVRFASFRGPKSSGEHMTITSGSMRRLVRESILFDDKSLPSKPIASSAAISSTRNSTSRKSGVSAVDIASWWENNSNSNSNDTPKNSNSATITNEGSDSSNSLPLYQNISAGSNSSGTPHQYRASLSTFIFGTLSKSSGSAAALVNEANKDEVNINNNNVSRHNSFRRGTLSRNTLRSITASATNGVNRSIKGLFDHSLTSTSNKVVPDDSQKMELDSEPIQMAIEEKITVSSLQQDQQQQQYNSVHQKSIRISPNTRPSLASSYLPSSESSTKYALSDEEDYMPDESSKKTALDENQELSLMDEKKDAPKKSDYQPKVELPESSSATDMTSSTNGEVDIIRRMLQDTWINNMRESGSMFSILSDTDSIATTSTQQSASTQQSTSATNTNKLNPRQQNQSLLTKSLLTQQVAKRASLLARTGISSDDIGFIFQQGPEPSASFSSSTVRTMVPTNESASMSSGSEPINIRQNAIASAANSSVQHNNNNGSNKIQESSYDEKSGSLSSSVLLSRFSTSPMDATTSSSPRNSSAESSRGHSRKSSGGNSAATALRISSGYSANAKTWNGRAQKRSSRPSVTRLLNDDDSPSAPDSPNLASSSESQQQQQFHSIGRASVNKRAFFSTMRKGQKNRGSIPWMIAENDDEEEERTPAQIERDRYLEGKY